MLKQSLVENVGQETVPSPQTNGHRPLKKACSNDPNAPPVPPRTYSQRLPVANGVANRSPPQPRADVCKPSKCYNLKDFKFVKLLGKGSFGKVRE